jgi:hypothetical protein
MYFVLWSASGYSVESIALCQVEAVVSLHELDYTISTGNNDKIIQICQKIIKQISNGLKLCDEV